MGIEKSIKIINGGIVKHNWQLDTNTGTFTDKVTGATGTITGATAGDYITSGAWNTVDGFNTILDTSL